MIRFGCVAAARISKATDFLNAPRIYMPCKWMNIVLSNFCTFCIKLQALRDVFGNVANWNWLLGGVVVRTQGHEEELRVEISSSLSLFINYFTCSCVERSCQVFACLTAMQSSTYMYIHAADFIITMQFSRHRIWCFVLLYSNIITIDVRMGRPTNLHLHTKCPSCLLR